MGRKFETVPNDLLDYRGLDTLFEKASVLQSWLDVEKAVAQAQADLGLIPAESAQKIIENCEFEKLDELRLTTGFETTKHPLVPIINEVVHLCGPDHGGYVHWGITTQNVIQTGMLSLVMRAHQTIEAIFTELLGHLSIHARDHAKTVMPGRTHSRHAVPVTFGFKVAVWIEELFQGMERLQEAKVRTFVVMMGGAVGCHSALGGQGPAFQSRVADLLGMGEMAIPSRAIRTHIAEYASALTMLGAVCHRIAEEIYVSTSEEFGELSERTADGVIGSSTMPQKVNPSLSCKIISNAQKLYAQNALILSVTSRPFESDASANGVIESVIADMIDHFANIIVPIEALIRDLQVDAERMRENLKLSNGTIFAELAMMKVGKNLGKHKGHELVHEIATAHYGDTDGFLAAIGTLPNGEALKQDIIDSMNGDNGTGLCSEYALHYSSLASGVDPRTLPNVTERAKLPLSSESC